MTSPVREGDILAGKYRVERVLGEGGMGVVVAARHIELDERVAIKFLLPAVAGDPEALGRFLREARAAVRIKSEHVVRVTDVGTLSDGVPYMVMEYLDGIDLAEVLRAEGVLPFDTAVDYAVQTCEAIASVHAMRIVHRDLKPSNLMRVHRQDGSACIKVLDFGISKVVAPDSPLFGLTKTTAVLGSPLYMSPEQMMSSRGVDGRTDIWAIGTILYELLAGQPPFAAETMHGLAVQIATAQPIALRSLRSDVPSPLEATIARCLAKRPDDRYQNVAELAQALRPLAPQRALAAIDRTASILRTAGLVLRPEPESAVMPETERAPAALPATFSNWGQTSSSKPRRGTVVAFAAVAITAGVGLTAAGLAFRSRTPIPSVAVSASPGPPVSTPELASIGLAQNPDVPDTGETPLPASATASAAHLPEVIQRPLAVPAATTPRVLSPHAASSRPPASAPAPAGVNCHIQQEYDSDGEPHFKKVCQ